MGSLRSYQSTEIGNVVLSILIFSLNFGRSVYVQGRITVLFRSKAEYFKCTVDYLNLFINLVKGVIIGMLEIESYQNERTNRSVADQNTGKKTEKSENGYEEN